MPVHAVVVSGHILRSQGRWVGVHRLQSVEYAAELGFSYRHVAVSVKLDPLGRYQVSLLYL